MRGRFSQPSVAAVALAPLRFFLGGTFVYAGLDKLLDPRFFDPASAASIQAQMLVFTRVSPIGGLVRLGQPLAVPIGLAIAFAEIAVGIGALTGLAFRLAASVGAALAILFFLTASWSTHPFYYGPDLPVAAGWITLALTGHGGVLIARRLIDSVGPVATPPAAPPGTASPTSAVARAHPAVAADRPALEGRRAILQAGLLGLLALVAGSLAVPFRTAAPEEDLDSQAPGPSPAASPVASAPGASAGASGAIGARIATTAELLRSGAKAFTVPFTAAAPLPAGDPGVVVRLADGSFVAFDATCTHAGCRVEWDRQDQVLVCPCHGAVFDPAADGAAVDGPTNEPLARLPISVDATTGTITLRG